MKAALLCPGPSLSQFAGGDYRWVFAINRAALLHPCTYWVALDSPLIREVSQQVADRQCGVYPSLISTRTTVKDLQRRGMTYLSEMAIEIDSLVPAPSHCGWTLFSATAALVFAFHLGVTELDCFGIDRAGELDWDGTRGSGNRSVARWEAERSIWDKIILWLGGRMNVRINGTV